MQGRLVTKAQEDAVAHAVKGQIVVDLGAGCCELSKKLVELGAKQVLAVDKEFPLGFIKPYPKVQRIHQRFEELPFYPTAVHFISWPPNWECGLLQHIKAAGIIVYLGKNTDGMSCATRDIWEYLVTREILAYAPHKKNTLIVYGPGVKKHSLRGEEEAGLEHEMILYYEQLEDIRPESK